MKVLGIDTTTQSCSVAVVSSEKVLAEYTLQVEKTHSERLLPLVDSVLRDAGVNLSDLGGIVVSAGPGSFTGVRIGMATAKALGQALGLPLAGVSSLAALAAQAPFFSGTVSPMLDARRKQVYNAFFQAGNPPQRLLEDRTISVAALLEDLREMPGEVLFTGDGVPVYMEAIKSLLGERALFQPQESCLPRASTVGRLGLGILAAGKGMSYLEIAPSYVRRSEAEVKYELRHGKGAAGSVSGN